MATGSRGARAAPELPEMTLRCLDGVTNGLSLDYRLRIKASGRGVDLTNDVRLSAIGEIKKGEEEEKRSRIDDSDGFFFQKTVLSTRAFAKRRWPS